MVNKPIRPTIISGQNLTRRVDTEAIWQQWLDASRTARDLPLIAISEATALDKRMAFLLLSERNAAHEAREANRRLRDIRREMKQLEEDGKL